MVAAVDDLVDVAERDVRRVDAVVGQEADLLERAGARFAVGQDRCAGPPVRGGRRLEHPPVALGRSAVAAGDLDHAGPDTRSGGRPGRSSRRRRCRR